MRINFKNFLYMSFNSKSYFTISPHNLNLANYSPISWSYRIKALLLNNFCHIRKSIIALYLVLTHLCKIFMYDIKLYRHLNLFSAMNIFNLKILPKTFANTYFIIQLFLSYTLQICKYNAYILTLFILVDGFICMKEKFGFNFYRLYLQ